MVDIRRGSGQILGRQGGFSAPRGRLPQIEARPLGAPGIPSWGDTEAPRFWRRETGRLAKQAESLAEIQAVSYLAGIDQDLRETASRLEVEHDADPEAFENAYGAYVDGLLESLPDPLLAEPVRRRAATRGLESGRRVMGEHVRRTRESGRADLISGFDALKREAARSAAEGNMEQLESFSDEFAVGIEAGLAHGLLTGTEAAAMRDEWRRELLTETSLAEFEAAASQPEPLPPGGVSFDQLVERVALAESGGRQFAESGEPLTSPAGAVGVMQVTEPAGKESAAELGIGWDRERWRTDEDYNRALGETYLRMQMQAFGGRQVLALSAYNAGPENTRFYERKTIEKHGANYTDAQFVATVEEVQKRVTSGRGEKARSETANYVRKIMGAAPEEGGPVGLGFIRDYLAADVPGLSPAEQRRAAEQMFAQLERRLRIEDRLESRAERERQERQEAAATSFAVRVLDGDVGQGDLRDALERRAIDRQQFAWLDALRTAPETIVDDPTAALELYSAAAGAEPDVPRRLAEARARGLIRTETAVSYLRTFESARQQGGRLADADVKRQAGRIDQTLGGMRGPLAILDQAQSERVQGALQEYHTRILDQPEEPPAAIADDIIERYRLAPQPVTALPAPRYLVGTRAAPDVTASMAATLDALERGEITELEAGREILNLEAIAEIMEETAQRAREQRR